MLGFRKDITGGDCDAVAREIAERCADAILAQSSGQLQQMNAAQLRGYVRARAWSQVWVEVQVAAAAGRVRARDVNDLAARVLEQTVHYVAAASSAPPVIAMPMPHIRHRAA